MGCNITSWTDSKVLEYIGNTAFTNIKTSEIDLPGIKELGHIALVLQAYQRYILGLIYKRLQGHRFIVLLSEPSLLM